MNKKDKEQDGVLLKEKIAKIIFNIDPPLFVDWEQETDYVKEAYYKIADRILAKAREAVKGAGLKLNRGGILSDVEVAYYNNGAEAQTQAILKALGGE